MIFYFYAAAAFVAFPNERKKFVGRLNPVARNAICKFECALVARMKGRIQTLGFENDLAALTQLESTSLSTEAAFTVKMLKGRIHFSARNYDEAISSFTDAFEVVHTLPRVGTCAIDAIAGTLMECQQPKTGRRLRPSRAAVP